MTLAAVAKPAKLASVSWLVPFAELTESRSPVAFMNYCIEALDRELRLFGVDPGACATHIRLFGQSLEIVKVLYDEL